MKTKIVHTKVLHMGLKPGGLAIFDPEVYGNSSNVFLTLDLEEVAKYLKVHKGELKGKVMLITLSDDRHELGYDFKDNPHYVPVEQVNTLEVRRL